MASAILSNRNVNLNSTFTGGLRHYLSWDNLGTTLGRDQDSEVLFWLQKKEAYIASQQSDLLERLNPMRVIANRNFSLALLLAAITASFLNAQPVWSFGPHMPEIAVPDLTAVEKVRDFKQDMLLLTPAESKRERKATKFRSKKN
jgi:hypothetical protein